MLFTSLRAIHIGFAEAEANDAGYAYFDVLQRLTGLVDRPEPIAAMAKRIGSPDFLENAAENVARHLYANTFLVIDHLCRHSETPQFIARLMASTWMKAAYAPAILETLTKHDPTNLRRYMTQLSDFFQTGAIRERAIAVVRNVIGSLNAFELVDVFRAPAFEDVEGRFPHLRMMLAAGIQDTPNALTAALLRTAAAQHIDQVDQVDEQVMHAYEELPPLNRMEWRQYTTTARMLGEVDSQPDITEDLLISTIAIFRANQNRVQVAA